MLKVPDLLLEFISKNSSKTIKSCWFLLAMDTYVRIVECLQMKFAEVFSHRVKKFRANEIFLPLPLKEFIRNF